MKPNASRFYHNTKMRMGLKDCLTKDAIRQCKTGGNTKRVLIGFIDGFKEVEIRR